jgi:hypothetical protein
LTCFGHVAPLEGFTRIGYHFTGFDKTFIHGAPFATWRHSEQSKVGDFSLRSE